MTRASKSASFSTGSGNNISAHLAPRVQLQQPDTRSHVSCPLLQCQCYCFSCFTVSPLIADCLSYSTTGCLMWRSAVATGWSSVRTGTWFPRLIFTNQLRSDQNQLKTNLSELRGYVLIVLIKLNCWWYLGKHIFFWIIQNIFICQVYVSNTSFRWGSSHIQLNIINDVRCDSQATKKESDKKNLQCFIFNVKFAGNTPFNVYTLSYPYI